MMKAATLVVGSLFLLTACASTAPAPQSGYEVKCRTHARQATFSGSPDEQGIYLECLKVEGRHDIEVTEIK